MDHSQMKHIYTDDGVVMVMQGIPGWMFAVGVGLIVLLSFLVVEWRGLSEGEGFRFNLTGPRFHRLIRKRWFQFAFQAPVLVLFLFTIYAGLFGSYARNIAPVLVWTVWWAGLIFTVAVAGNLWCFVCPWDALSNLASRLSFWKKRENLSLGIELPPWATNVYPALALFVVVTWAELGWGITNNPRITATMGALMAMAAMAGALVFEKKAFCRSVCLVGRTGGMYSMFAPVEIRARDPRVCEVCPDHVCKTGGPQSYACPTGLDMSSLNENTYCTMCTECFKSCPSHVPTVRLRPFGRDMPRVKNLRTDEAWLALTLLSLTAFHGLSMTPAWLNYEPGTADMVGWIRETAGVGSLGAFTVGMAGVMALPVLAHTVSSALAAAWVKDSGVGFRQIFVAYAYAVLPVALFYHLAHNTMHLFMEGQELISRVSDPMGTGANWFGTATWHLEPLLSEQTTWLLQVLLILVGHVFGVLVAHRIAKRLFADRRLATRSLVPMLVMMVSLSVGGLWLMSLDMNMRMGRM